VCLIARLYRSSNARRVAGALCALVRLSHSFVAYGNPGHAVTGELSQNVSAHETGTVIRTRVYHVNHVSG